MSVLVFLGRGVQARSCDFRPPAPTGAGDTATNLRLRSESRNYALLHHENHLPHRPNVPGRISPNGDQIGEGAFGDRSEVLEIEVKEGSPIVNTPLKDLHFPRGAIIGAIVHGKSYEIPDGENCLKKGDRVLVFALPEGVTAVEEFFAGGEK